MTSCPSRRRVIAVFTGSRAEYGLLKPVLRQLHEQSSFDVRLLVSGGHLAQTQGHTVEAIEADGFRPHACVDLGLDACPPVHQALGRAVEGVGRVLERLRPDLFLVLGDRYETLGAVLAAYVERVPVAHINGGDLTLGALDEGFRHAITKLSHFHFPACEAYRMRIIQLGEAPERVWNVGALGVENALAEPVLPEAEVRRFLDLPDSVPYALCTYHPATLERTPPLEQVEILLAALASQPELRVVLTAANADDGGEIINARLKAAQKEQPERYRFFYSLGVPRYLNACRHAACVVGNSSSGVVEIPSLGIPVVDVGSRQEGRLRSEAVIHCEMEVRAISEALEQALQSAWRTVAASAPNPYERPLTSRTIVQRLGDLDLQSVPFKRFHTLKGI